MLEPATFHGQENYPTKADEISSEYAELVCEMQPKIISIEKLLKIHLSSIDNNRYLQLVERSEY